MLSTGLAFVFVVGLCGIVSLWLFDFYRIDARSKAAETRRRWAETWEFSPQEVGGFTHGKLALVSVLGLFLELLMIRWVSSEIQVFAYFKNFVLIACFLGDDINSCSDLDNGNCQAVLGLFRKAIYEVRSSRVLRVYLRYFSPRSCG